MSAPLEVRHVTTYRYARPVRFGEHRMMLRPRDSHDMRVLATALVIEPAASVRWVHDVFGNSIAIASFSYEADTLTVESSFRIEHFPAEAADIVVDPGAATYPFAYASDDLVDLRSCLEMASGDAGDSVGRWARSFLGGSYHRRTLDLLIDMNGAIRRDFQYVRREDAGTQSAAETLRLGSGSCRDFAMLLMDAARHLGIAARFVSGYGYDEMPASRAGYAGGSGSTHAWAELFLPAAGWVEFDPTNGIVGGRNLIRVAVARAPWQAMPLSGSFNGRPRDFLGMTVSVEVSLASDHPLTAGSRMRA